MNVNFSDCVKFLYWTVINLKINVDFIHIGNFKGPFAGPRPGAYINKYVKNSSGKYFTLKTILQY